MKPKDVSNRRKFLQHTAGIASGLTAITALNGRASVPGFSDTRWSIVGPREGFTPHVGTVYSMLNMMTHIILEPVKDLSVRELDYLHDENANSIGAMLWHVAATETYFQLNTFEKVKWGNWSEEVRRKWDIPMNLGKEAREKIKGNSLDFYQDVLSGTREKTVEGFRQRDDDWLMQEDPLWGWNNYAKWFHVAEHYSNHNGQIKWIKSRLSAR